MIVSSKRHHHPRCLSFLRAGANASSCSVFSASLLKSNYGRLIDFLNKIKKLPTSICLIKLTFWCVHASLVFRFVVWCDDPGCANTFPALSFIGNSGGLIITAHTSPYLFCPPSSCRPTYNRRNVSCVLHAHSQYLCSLASFKLSTSVSAISASYILCSIVI